MSTIITSTTSTTAYQVSADTTGTLVIQTGATPTTAVTVGSDQSVGIGTTSILGNSLLNVVQGVVARNSGATVGYFQTYNSNAGADLKTWRLGGDSSGSLIFATVNDAYSSSTTRFSSDSSGNFAFNSGYGSVATVYGCRAWINFNGTGTIAIRASGNVTSITDNGVGNYTITFTNAMPNTNYAVTGNPSNTAQAYLYGLDVFALNTGSVQVRTHDYNSLQDVATISVAVFR